MSAARQTVRALGAETAILDRLKAAVGAGGWIAEPGEIAPHLSEWRGKFRGASPLLLKPASTAEVAEIVGICAETGTKIVPQGGNTSLVGGSIPSETGDEIIVNLARMNRVRAIDPFNDTMTVEAGCILAAAQQAAQAAGRLLPLRIASEGSCQIGGNIATNAGGTNVLRYGNARELVLGLEIVLPDGRIWDGLRGLRKDNTGYDLKQLFIGSEGTLGIVTAAVLKLFPLPAALETALVAVPDLGAALQLLALAKERSGGQVTAFELLPRLGLDFVLRHVAGTREPFSERHDWQILLELASGQAGDGLRAQLEDLLAEAYERVLVRDAIIAESGQQAEAFWLLREAMSEAQGPEGGSIKCDIAVPLSAVPAFITEASEAVRAICPGARIVGFGHLGDGNIHFNSSQPVDMAKADFLALWDEISALVHDIAHRLGGSISAEHGVGRLKREEIKRYKQPVEIELMTAIKRALDPQNILNPGRIIG
jgi:FAD/FMN-containing dehydrogenase